MLWQFPPLRFVQMLRGAPVAQQVKRRTTDLACLAPTPNMVTQVKDS